MRAADAASLSAQAVAKLPRLSDPFGHHKAEFLSAEKAEDDVISCLLHKTFVSSRLKESPSRLRLVNHQD
ncbi:hypothetical protein CABS02_15380 [Colletotrichum abscissum]|uniref:Uncharacterized protein n=1 Tax=Colletotrichum abscissum TaxID=1671311 RepID=A0A9Q0AVA5_9PEZI|nr:hypothetical protein CABS02_15380 [Colletotrichum abscissum]